MPFIFLPETTEASRGEGNKIGLELAKMERPKIVLFGDSIVQDSLAPGGWGASLAYTFSRKADVVVRGYEEYNTRWASDLVNQLFSPNGSTPPCATLIFFGANDSVLLGSSSQQQHVPQEQYKDNLRKIVDHLKELSSSMVVVLVTPLPVDEFGREQHTRSLFGDKKKVPNRTNKMTGSYVRKCLDLAQEMRLPWIDLWSAMQQISNWQKHFFDRSHLTDQGNAFVYREVVQVLIEAGINAHDMQIDFPHHFEIEEAQTKYPFQQDIDSSHLVDLDLGEDLAAEMLIPSCYEDSKLISTPLQTTTTFEHDPLQFSFLDDAFFPSTYCLTSSPDPCSSYMVDPTSFKYIEDNKCQDNPIIKIKEEPLSFVATSSSNLVPTHIKEEYSGPTTPLKEDLSMGPTLVPKKVGKGSRNKSYRKHAQPPSWPCNKNETTVGKMCAHCKMKKTPQWRAGPNGAKSLCNACGVRYKQGRLYPEYRPIHSPTFVPELHSNSHKEVEKMRRLKRCIGQQ